MIGTVEVPFRDEFSMSLSLNGDRGTPKDLHNLKNGLGTKAVNNPVGN